MLKVCQRPDLIQSLKHGLIFANDATVNDALLTKYSLWDYLTPCDADNLNILNANINRWRDEANQLYKTTLFEYNPIENYNMVEHSKDVRTPDLTDERTPDLTDEISYASSTTNSESDYDSPRVLLEKAKSENGGSDTTTHTGTDTTTHTGTDTNDHELTRAGNTGVTTTQQMIEQERKIIIDCLAWYVAKFEHCFTVSLSIADYECCSPLDDEIIAEFTAPCGESGSSITGKLDVIDNEIGSLDQKLTECCSNMASEIEQLKKSSSDSKTLLAGAITSKGVPTADDATFAEMADNIAAIPTGGNWVLVADWDFTQSLTDSINGYVCTLGSYTTQDSAGIHFTQNTTSSCKLPYGVGNYPSDYIIPRPGMAIEFDIAAEGTFANSGQTMLIGIASRYNGIEHYNVNAPAGVTRWVWRLEQQSQNINLTDDSLTGKTVRIELSARGATAWIDYSVYIDGVFIATIQSPYYVSSANNLGIALGSYVNGQSYRGPVDGIISGLRIYNLS